MHKHASTNRYYRLVWSHIHSCWVAVAEGARGRGKSASRKLTAVLVGTALSGAALAAPPGLAGIAAPTPKALPATPAANALPTGVQVVAGQASVSQAANQMTVRQGSDKAILNWQSFDIGANAGVRFVQPNANAVALNRVLGNDPSRIYGQLSANGKVFLVNQSGVLFGASARVDVGGLIASSLALPDGDFLAGRYTFSGGSNAGAVRNEGSIRTGNGGYVALLGPSVSNAGSIVAPNGSVALGAGEQIGVDLRGDGLITLRVDRGAVAALAGNSGLVQADGGRVELSAKGADALARATVNNTGVVQARGLVTDGGSVRLVGDEVHAGALDVSSRNGSGGQVALEGAFVALDGAIDASGARGGSVSADAGVTLSTAATTQALGRTGEGGTIRYRSGGAVVESVTASTDASGVTQGGTIAVHGDAGVLTSASHSARSSAGTGGRIDVSGASVRLLGAQLDASGNTQGGLVRVGGAFQGGAVREDAPDLARFVARWGQTAPIANAASTFVGDGATIKVGALGRNGQGGTAVVWSDQQTTMLGSIDARGAGAAGTVEISSKDELRHVGLERIALGSGGQLLLDPKNITIGSGSGSAGGQWTYQAILGNGYSGNKEVGVALTEGAMFGSAVALNAAGDRMAVGTPGDRGAYGQGDNAGAVRLYSFSDNNFSNATLQATIGAGYSGGKNVDLFLQNSDQFGAAVALNADATRLAVGAPGENGGYGAAHVFSFADSQFGGLNYVGSLGAGYDFTHLQNASFFGASVALNAIGDRLAVGSLYDGGASGACNACGAVYLYNNAATMPTFVQAIGAGYGVNMPLAAESQFGTAVAFDASGDRLAVGAYGVNQATGAVYLFNNAYGATALAATIATGAAGGKNLDPGLGADGWFGSSVALNSAGTRLAVGASNDGAGKVRIIDFADSQFSAPTVSAILGAGQTGSTNTDVALQPSEGFGYSLALNGAGDRMVVGSPFSEGNNGSLADSGTVRAFALSAGPVGSLVFGSDAGADATVDAAALARTLDGGTSITLQANNDITLAANHAIAIGDGSGNGSLTLQAGRSIFLNSSITTGNANLTLVANETTANGVSNPYRDAGAAVIVSAAGTTINAGSGRVAMTIADGAGKTYRDSGAIQLGGALQAGSVSLKNLGTSVNSDVVIAPSGGILGTGNGLIEVATTNAGSTFLNFAGAAGINPGAGRYLVYANNPDAALEGLSGYNKHYSQTYTGSAPAYAGNGNWFLYSVTPTLNVSAAAAGKTYDGTTALPALGFSASGFIDGDNSLALTGALGVTGMNKNVGAYTIGIGTLGTSLGYAIHYTGNVLTVTPRMLNAIASADNKIYDGGTAANVALGDDRVAGDQLSLGFGNASFFDKNAGNGKPVTVTGVTLGGNDAGNYMLASTTITTGANIFARVLNANATGLNKTYDGGTAANVVLGDDRISGDVLSLSADSASFTDKNAGLGKTVTVTGITLGGVDAGNYALASTVATTGADILKRSLTASATGVNKTYDGSSAATVGFSDDRVAGDVLAYASTASFADKNAGLGKAVTVSGIALVGQDAGNYTLASSTGATSAAILKRSLTASAIGLDKTYDGGTAANVVLGDDRVLGDDLSLSAGSASFADKNAGLGKTVTVGGIALDGQDAGNYTLASTGATTSANIGKRTLHAQAVGVDKTYDGGTAATVTFGDDRVAGDVLGYTSTASFADKNAGSGKTVSVSGITVVGQDAGNYALASTTGATSAEIGKRTLVVGATGVDKTYDGGTTASVTFGDDRVAGDALAYTGSASFADKNAGLGKTVTVSGIALGGQDAGNYALASTGATTSADIAKRTLVVGATGVDKTYDGGTTASVTFGDDRVAGDVLGYTGAASFADKNAGSGKAVSVTGIVVGGQDAGNYALASTSASTTANIGRRVLNAQAAGVDKVYDGGLGATVRFGDDRVAGDLLAYTSTARFSDKNVGSGKTVSVSGIALGGQDAGNYTLSSSTGVTTAGITQRVLKVNATGIDKVYDGTTVAGVTLGDDRVAGDQLNLSSSDAAFADKNAGATKAIRVNGIALGGQDAANYALASTTAGASAAITPRTLRVSASGVDKVYDGNTLAKVVLGDDRLGNDQLNIAGNARFADKSAGSGKAVQVTGLALSGMDAGNYRLADAGLLTRASIAQAPLTVKASNATRTAGLNNPVFGYSVSGLIQGDSPAILPAFVTASNATPQSAPGEYAITVGSNATLNDYKLAFVDGVLTVTGASPELNRAIRATIAPALPLEVTGGGATVAQQQDPQQSETQERALPRVDALRPAANPAPAAGARPDGTIVTLSGGTEVLTRNGGVRSAQ